MRKTLEKINDFIRMIEDNQYTFDRDSSVITSINSHGSRLYSIKIVSGLTGLDRNKIAYNMRVLCISPIMHWNKENLYSQEDIVDLLHYLRTEHKLQSLKEKKKRTLTKNENE